MSHEERCAELYRIGNTPADLPDGLLVVGATSCQLCKQTMRNNDYVTQTTDGTPVTWINISEQDGLYKFYTLPGVHYSDEQESAMVGEHRLGHTPIYLWVENGGVSRGPLASGELPEGGLDALALKAKGF
jgi:hypothetical protein